MNPWAVLSIPYRTPTVRKGITTVTISLRQAWAAMIASFVSVGRPTTLRAAFICRDGSPPARAYPALTDSHLLQRYFNSRSNRGALDGSMRILPEIEVKRLAHGSGLEALESVHAVRVYQDHPCPFS
jgi:hypothetical protein